MFHNNIFTRKNFLIKESKNCDYLKNALNPNLIHCILFINETAFI